MRFSWRVWFLMLGALMVLLAPSSSAFTTPSSHNATRRVSFSTTLAVLPADLETTKSKSQLWNNVAGGLTFGGGLLGFATKGSKASLIAGSTFGGLLLVSSAVTQKLSSKSIGLWVGSIVSSMLSYVMGKKFLASKKFVPSGLIASLGILAAVHNVWGIVLSMRGGGGAQQRN